MRMSSAKTPPTAKKISVATRNITPIRLWSSVVSQDFSPVAGVLR